jgi:hypothetical protein
VELLGGQLGLQADDVGVPVRVHVADAHVDQKQLRHGRHAGPEVAAPVAEAHLCEALVPDDEVEVAVGVEIRRLRPRLHQKLSGGNRKSWSESSVREVVAPSHLQGARRAGEASDRALAQAEGPRGGLSAERRLLASES